jgi:1,4-dihydroxy-2-naphthoate octaprenyltransferase
VFNELSDYETGIDNWTTKTPFSGGSGRLQAGETKPNAVRLVAYGTLIGAGCIGCYLGLTSGWPLFIFMAVGALAIRFYTTHLAKWLIGEGITGLCMGTLVVLGVYYTLTRQITWEVLLISLPPGLLTSLLLLLNEFPDVEADRRGGRYHLVIHFGKRTSARIYAGTLIIIYLLVVIIPLVTSYSFFLYLALLTMPLAIRAASIANRTPDDLNRMVQALGLNVLIVLGTDLLLAIGLLIEGGRSSI